MAGSGSYSLLSTAVGCAKKPVAARTSFKREDATRAVIIPASNGTQGMPELGGLLDQSRAVAHSRH